MASEPITVAKVFKDYRGRRTALIHALTKVIRGCFPWPFVYGASFNVNDRKRLFSLINRIPTVLEVVNNWNKDKSTVASGSKSQESTKAFVDKKKLKMRQRKWLEFLKDYNFNLSHHPSKVNVEINALSRKSSYVSALMIHVVDVAELRMLSLRRGRSSNLSVRLGVTKMY
ncbi:PHD finger protein ALFIN-LIKE 2, partial [Mucuna pruriens]